jgi:hypothetical protein
MAEITRADLVVTYRYAWRGGPRLAGEPGSPEFLASWQAALKTQRTPDPELFKSLIEAYKASAAFTHAIGERTRDDYRKQLARIAARCRSHPGPLFGTHDEARGSRDRQAGEGAGDMKHQMAVERSDGKITVLSIHWPRS